MGARSARGKRWRFLRLKKLESVNWKCERCGRAGRLEVHHREELAEGGDMYDFNNLEVLCRRCHFAEHDKHGLIPKRAEWDVYMKELR